MLWDKAIHRGNQTVTWSSSKETFLPYHIPYWIFTSEHLESRACGMVILMSLQHLINVMYGSNYVTVDVAYEILGCRWTWEWKLSILGIMIILNNSAP